MPYEVKKSGKGYKVFSPNGPHSKKSMTLRQAYAQKKAIEISTGGK
jgi:hypothetical protein